MRLEQMLDNVLANASEFTRAGNRSRHPEHMPPCWSQRERMQMHAVRCDSKRMRAGYRLLSTRAAAAAEHPKPHIPGSIPDTPAEPPPPVDDPDPVDTPDEQPRDD